MIPWWWLLVGLAIVGVADVLGICLMRKLRGREPVELRCRTRDGACRYGACKARGECLAAPRARSLSAPTWPKPGGAPLLREASEAELQMQRESWARGQKGMGSDRDEAVDRARLIRPERG